MPKRSAGSGSMMTKTQHTVVAAARQPDTIPRLQAGAAELEAML